MKRACLCSLMGAGLLLASDVGASGSDTVQLSLSAVVRPGTCTVSASSNNIDLGEVRFSSLAQSEPTSMPFVVNPELTIECTAVHRGVYFTVDAALLDEGGDAGHFTLGDWPLAVSSPELAPMGYYTLSPANVRLGGVLASDAQLMQRADETVAATAAAENRVVKGVQYSFADVVNNGAQDIAFNLNGTLELPSLDSIVAANSDLLSSAHAFSSSLTVSVVF